MYSSLRNRNAVLKSHGQLGKNLNVLLNNQPLYKTLMVTDLKSKEKLYC